MIFKRILFLFILSIFLIETKGESAESCKSNRKQMRVFAKPIGCGKAYMPKYRCVTRRSTFQKSFVLDEMPDHPESSYPGRREEFSDLLIR